MLMRRQLAQLIRRVPLLMRIPYYMYRMFQPKFSVGVVGVVLNQKREVLLVEHVFHPTLPWGLPGGWIGANEAPEHAVKREFYEELGLTIETESLLLAGKTGFRHIDFAYLCDAKDQITTLSYELLGYEWVAYENLPRLNLFHQIAINTAFEKLKNKE